MTSWFGLDLDETIHQWEVNSISFEFFFFIISKEAKKRLYRKIEEKVLSLLERAYYEKRKRTGIYTLILFFAIFFEPYASKGACTVFKGYNFTLINRLYRERLLFLGQGVDSEISNQLIGLMVYLSIEDDTKDLYLFINSPGGWVIPGVAIYDTMQFVQPDVHTICMGLAASMGSFLLVGGEITKRLAFPHAWRQWGFFFSKKKTMPSPYEIWILSKNSMAFRIRYEKNFSCFFKRVDYIYISRE